MLEKHVHVIFPFFLYKSHIFCKLHLFAECYISFCNYYVFSVSSDFVRHNLTFECLALQAAGDSKNKNAGGKKGKKGAATTTSSGHPVEVRIVINATKSHSTFL